MAVPNLKLNTGHEMPQLGLGTWKSKPGEVTQAVKDAIEVGYRHIDCAHVYQNEKEVGAGLAAKFKDGTVKRDDIFITSKLWCTHHNPKIVESACRQTLSDLGLEYLDLYLVHWPFAFKEGHDLFPTNPDGSIAGADYDYLDTWKAMEQLVAIGLCRSIGISNFNKSQIERLISQSNTVPAVHQFECHAHLAQLKLSAFCASKGIVVTAYSPLGSPDRPYAKPGEPTLLEIPKLKEIAAKHHKSPAQVLIRYQIDRGHVVIPKSVTKSRIAENFNILDFKLNKEEIEAINAFNTNWRCCPMTESAKLPYYAFNDFDQY